MKYLLFISILFSNCTKSQFVGAYIKPSISTLIFVSGESNARGIAANSSATTLEKSSRTNAKILNNNNLLFENLLIGTNNFLGNTGVTDSFSHSFEIGLANAADTLKFGVNPLYLVKSGYGGARIRFYNDSTLNAYSPPANAWELLKPRFDTALKLATTANGGIRPRVFLIWTQGINDAIDGVSTSVWKDSTEHFFTKFRARYGQVPIFMTYLIGDGLPYNTTITTIASEVSECYAIDVTSATTANADHWDYAGFKLITYRIVEAIRQYYPY